MRIAALFVLLAAVSCAAAAAATPAKQVTLATKHVRLPPSGEVTLVRWSFDIRRKDGKPVRRGVRVTVGASNAAKLRPSIIAVGAVGESRRRPGHFVALFAIANKRAQRSLARSAADEPDLITLIVQYLQGTRYEMVKGGTGFFAPLPETVAKLKAHEANEAAESPAVGQFLEPLGDAPTAEVAGDYGPGQAVPLDAGPPVGLSPLKLLKGYVGIAQAAVGDKPVDAAFIRRFADANFEARAAAGEAFALTPLLTWTAQGGCTAGRVELPTKRVVLKKGESTILTWIGRSGCADNFRCGLNDPATRDNRFGLPAYIAYTFTCGDAHPGVNGAACNTVPTASGCEVKLELFLKNEKP